MARLVNLIFLGGDFIQELEFSRIARYATDAYKRTLLIDSGYDGLAEQIKTESPIVYLRRTPVLVDFEAGSIHEGLIERIIPTANIKEVVFSGSED